MLCSRQLALLYGRIRKSCWSFYKKKKKFIKVKTQYVGKTGKSLLFSSPLYINIHIYYAYHRRSTTQLYFFFFQPTKTALRDFRLVLIRLVASVPLLYMTLSLHHFYSIYLNLFFFFILLFFFLYHFFLFARLIAFFLVPDKHDNRDNKEHCYFFNS